MKNFKEKIKRLMSSKQGLDDHIWNIFRRYIKQEGILFSSPSSWSYDGERIQFEGKDGCMGCYDDMWLSIPLKFFINPDEEFDNLLKQREREKMEKEELKKRAELERERQEYERLKLKFSE